MTEAEYTRQNLVKKRIMDERLPELCAAWATGDFWLYRDVVRRNCEVLGVLPPKEDEWGSPDTRLARSLRYRG